MSTVIRELKTGDEEALEEFLQNYIDSSVFLLSNLRATSLEYNGNLYEGNYAAVFKDDKIISTAAHYWNGMLIFQAPVRLEELLDHLLKISKRKIKGLIGLFEQADLARRHLQLETSAFQMWEPEGLYKLDLSEINIPGNLQTGEVTVRRIEARDLDVLSKWRLGYNIEVMNNSPSPELENRSRSEVEHTLAENKGWIAEIDSQPVSMTGFNARLPEIVQIGGVYTPPELRGRGYARAAIAQSLLDAREEGAHTSILFTGDDNPAAQKAYKSVGFRRIGDFCVSLI
jgi:uncharacterized protein